MKYHNGLAWKNWSKDLNRAVCRLVGGRAREVLGKMQKVLFLIATLNIAVLLNVANCNLDKVKIEPMLVMRCVFWGQRINPKAHVTRCRVVARAWHFACVFANCIR